jgi:FkbM family methyltransferase
MVMAAEAHSPRQAFFVRTRDGGVFVPPSIDYLSTYVLLEQEDWFEKEIRFLRRLLQPGMRVIDVGANYGVYTLAMSRAVGAGGAVWAFEPASNTLNFLRATVEANALAGVVVCPLALSDHAGVGHLGVLGNSELNSLVGAAAPSTETVQLATLEQQHAAHAMGSVDFIKLDAEGEEERILAGSRRFFGSQSPVVMFEIKAGLEFNTTLPAAFRGLGYQIYRLVGPDTLLVPVLPDETMDTYELNLFACKPDAAARLAARGLLVESLEPAPVPTAGAGVAFWQRQPYAAAWPAPQPGSQATPQWIDHYATWRDGDRPAAARYAALLAAIAAIHTLQGSRPTLTALASRARLLVEAGRRYEAVQALRQLLNRVQAEAEGPLIDSPVLPPHASFDGVATVGARVDWLAAAAVAAFASEATYSDYFAQTDYLAMLDWLQSTPYRSAAIERRRQLQALRLKRPMVGGLPPLLTVAAADHLNASLWAQGL